MLCNGLSLKHGAVLAPNRLRTFRMATFRPIGHRRTVRSGKLSVNQTPACSHFVLK
jgi:hypothetical protein